ncbi:putative ABC transport system permease protein [Catalinimonas alkaloidigena]|uniref:Putative ABC transport system permease protein n=1 Tax=Catalinimonas alkaloidigena TaxID=1075417 RepID=A0A1G9FCA4_9BACT|nr:ABC transporter permease [Catalinimonas alkaloidigena]SDK86024.1 putative ABC transport system permease protein [Catalinimonas alkaloidigena]
MTRNYLLIAWRNLKKNKVFSLINIAGLAVGMAACLLILQYVSFELSYDAFHENADQVYRVTVSGYKNGQLDVQVPKVFSAAGPALKKDFPEVAEYARLWPINGTLALTHDAIVFNERRVFFADPSVLRLFTFRVQPGATGHLLEQPSTGLLSASAARRYFGEEDPVGKTLVAQEGTHTLPFTVQGVFDDLSENSHLQVDFLFSHATLPSIMGETGADHDWESALFYTYLLLQPGTDPDQLAAKFPAFVERYVHMPQLQIAFALQPLRDIYLYSDMVQEIRVNGNGNAVYLLLAIALFLMLIAWMNYVNLSTARALERAQEIGVRKVAGASRTQLVQQFVLESVLLNALSMVLALTLFQLLQPYFAQLTGKPLRGLPFPVELLVIAFFGLGTVGAALYPAWVLSSFRPMAVLKGKIYHRGRGYRLRQGLVVFQFTTSLLLIAGTFVVARQLHFMRHQPLGMDLNQLLVLTTPDVVDTAYATQAQRFKDELENHAAFSSVVYTTSIPAKPDNIIHGGLRKAGTPATEGVQFYNVGIDQSFVDAFALQLLAGRNFSPQLDPPHETALLNEEAARAIGFQHPEEAVGQTIASNSWSLITVVGVVKNFHQQSLKSSHKPMVLYYGPDPTDQIGYFAIKMRTDGRPHTVQENIDQLEAAWQNAFPGNPFDYFFLDDYFDAQYRADQRFGWVFGVFTVLAIGIACLGLWGLSLLATSQRAKEMSVRKILGAPFSTLLLLLTKDFAKLLLLANLVAWPLAYWGIRTWLANYPFRIDISLGLFLVPSLLVFFIALLTVSVQTVKTALVNPADSLRSE